MKETEQEIRVAAQALDLRLRADGGVRLGQGAAGACDHSKRVSYLERDRLIMDDARRMVTLAQRRGLAGVLESTGDQSPVYKAAPDESG